MDIKTAEGTQKSIEVFCCYARKDQSLLLELKAHLMPLQRKGLTTLWADTDINAGAEWEKEIHLHLNAAHIILLLVSPDFMASEYCYSIEMQQALERHEKGEAKVIPIILRPVHWQSTRLGTLKALPTDAKPITDSLWDSRDQAFLDVVEGIRSIVESLSKPTSSNGELSLPPSYPIQLPHTTPRYIKDSVLMLDSAQPEERKQAVELLNQTDHPLVREIFIAALQHPVRDVRIQAAVSLLRFDALSALPQWPSALREALSQETNAWRRIAIVKALGELGDTSIVSELRSVIYDASPLVRKTAVDVLGQFGGKQALSMLHEFLHDPEAQVRNTVVDVLIRIYGQEAPSLLFDFLNDPDLWIRRKIVRYLGASSEIGTIPYLFDALTDSEPSVRDAAAQALSGRGSVAIPGLLNALHDPNSHTRRLACEALGKIGVPIAVPDLLQSLHDPEKAVIYSATTALGKIGNQEAIDTAITKVLEMSRGRNTYGIQILPGDDYGIDALVSIGSAALPHLRRAQSDPDITVRFIAKEALEKIGT
jgi:HEAT repeat protein